MLDYVIRSGTVIDGTGEPGRLADVGIRDGRIVAIGRVDDEGATELNAAGLIVMPGVVDPHTHYDAQLFWDPLASPSNVHGVTTIIGGNCGFTLAPINAEDADYIRQMMAKVEGMPLAALENGVPWNWSTFGEYLDRFEGRLGVNAIIIPQFANEELGRSGRQKGGAKIVYIHRPAIATANLKGYGGGLGGVVEQGGSDCLRNRPRQR